MEDNQVEIIAGAPGVIINKSDNYFDQNCSCVGTWNAVYIQHSRWFYGLVWPYEKEYAYG